MGDSEGQVLPFSMADCRPDMEKRAEWPARGRAAVSPFPGDILPSRTVAVVLVRNVNRECSSSSSAVVPVWMDRLRPYITDGDKSGRNNSRRGGKEGKKEGRAVAATAEKSPFRDRKSDRQSAKTRRHEERARHERHESLHLQLQSGALG